MYLHIWIILLSKNLGILYYFFKVFKTKTICSIISLYSLLAIYLYFNTISYTFFIRSLILFPIYLYSKLFFKSTKNFSINFLLKTCSEFLDLLSFSVKRSKSRLLLLKTSINLGTGLILNLGLALPQSTLEATVVNFLVLSGVATLTPGLESSLNPISNFVGVQNAFSILSLVFRRKTDFLPCKFL